MNKFLYNSPIGRLCIVEKQGKISKVSFFDDIACATVESILIKETYRQLSEYFDRKRKSFDIPLLLEGTDFQLKVWNALMEIPYGKTVSYKDVALTIGNSKAGRAVGMANNKNNIAIIIPCHRVIGSNGSLTGYAGGMQIKEYLLNLEKENMI